MKSVRLNQLKLVNFKGIKNLNVDFNKVTNIHGDNATGKTSIFDAFTWCLFGKDSTDRKQFEIKTLDTLGKVIPKIDHEVTAILDVDGKTIEIKRILREKWQKKRGNLEAEFTGNETLYYWNGVPLLANEFQAKIDNTINEGLFKLITNPLYFNSLSWQDQREVLIGMAGDITDLEIAQGNKAFLDLISGLEDKTIEEYKREISARRKKLNDDIKAIPTRIDEATKSMPDGHDFEAIKLQIINDQEKLKEVESLILDKNKAVSSAREERAKIEAQIFNLDSSIRSIEQMERNKMATEDSQNNSHLNDLKNKANELERKLLNNTNDLKSLSEQEISLSNKSETLREQWKKINASELVFEDGQFQCPTCKREHEADSIEQTKKELQENFNINKANELERISKNGKQLKSELESIKNDIKLNNEKAAELANEFAEITSKIEDQKADGVPQEPLSSRLNKNTTYKDAKAELSRLKETISDPVKVDVQELDQQKAELNESIRTLNHQLALEDVIIKTKARIDELEKSEKDLAQQMADLDGIYFNIDNFIKAKTENFEAKINKLFELVSFKLFETQINGSEVECCYAMYKGVPFSDLNNAGKIVAGLDIINTLCKFNEVSAPIFIDNRESINDIIPTDSQMINLIVSQDKSLLIN